MIIERDELERKLKSSIMEVTFNKINGDKRIMTCTLHPSHSLPATKKKKKDPLTQEKIRKINEEVMSVWGIQMPKDLEVSVWQISQRLNDLEALVGVRQASPSTCDGSHKNL